LKNVNLARVSVRGLQLANSAELEDDFFGKKLSPKKQERGRRAKPPMSASQVASSQNTG